MYIRLGFLDYMINNLVEDIEYNCSLFHSQLSEKACLGCHNFHITLVGSLQKRHKMGISRVFAEIRESVLTTNKLLVKAMCIRVTRNGCVKLIVEYNPKIIQLIKKIMGHIPDGNGYFSNTHITIGTYFGKDVREFCDKLNKKYSFNKFIIKATSVELDEDSTVNVPKVFLFKFKPRSLVVNKAI